MASTKEVVEYHLKCFGESVAGRFRRRVKALRALRWRTMVAFREEGCSTGALCASILNQCSAISVANVNPSKVLSQEQRSSSLRPMAVPTRRKVSGECNSPFPGRLVDV